MSPRLDVLVLGAGVVGLSSARQLASLGARVTVLDAGTPGGQGSRAAAGVCIPSVRLLDDPEMFALAMRAREVVQEDVASLGGGALRRGSGVVRPVTDDKSRAALEAKAESVPGYLGRWVSTEELVALEPALAGTPLMGAFVHDEGFLVDAEAYLNALLHDAAAQGVELCLGEAALEVAEGPAQVRVRTATRSLTCDRLVIAAGAWSGGLPGLAPLPVKPQRGQLISVLHPRVRLSRVISGPAYIAPWRAGEVVVGATEEDVGFANHTTPAGVLHLTATLARLAPVFREARFLTHWSGLRSTTPNGRLLLGPYPGMARTVLATGHGGQGIMTGALTGRAVAELIDRGRSDTAEPFLPARILERSETAPA